MVGNPSLWKRDWSHLPSRTPPSCWIEVLLLFLSWVASFFAADLRGICPSHRWQPGCSQEVSHCFPLEKGDGGKPCFFLAVRVECQEHVFLFCQLCAELWVLASFNSIFTSFLDDLGLLSAYLTVCLSLWFLPAHWTCSISSFFSLPHFAHFLLTTSSPRPHWPPASLNSK